MELYFAVFHGLFNCNSLLVFHSVRVELDGDDINCEAILCCCCSFGSIYSDPFILQIDLQLMRLKLAYLQGTSTVTEAG